MNGVQDEIVAIESGVINGTARVNSSNLNVTGTSTFASRPTMPPPDAALVFLQSTAAVGSSGLSTLSFLSEALVSNSSMHSTTTNPSRLTPQSTGFYQVAGQFALAGAPSAGSKFNLTLQDSSGGTIAQQSVKAAWAESGSVAVMGYKRFDVVGGYAVMVFENAGGGSTHSLSSGVGGTWFSMVKL
jgi:hypothetical protein